jgi:hypothetical protein
MNAEDEVKLLEQETIEAAFRKAMSVSPKRAADGTSLATLRFGKGSS